MGCKTCSLAVRTHEVRRLENRALKGMFRPKREEETVMEKTS
jgi:hypothetical protein